MCTLSLLRAPLPGETGATPLRWRVMFNRDERRSRTPAQPPRLFDRAGVRVLHPIDPEGGGTWIAVSEHGLVLALLNEYETSPAGAQPATFVSRGTIIPALAASGVRRAVDVPLDLIDALRVRPFRLVIADDEEIVEVSSRGGKLSPAAADRSRSLIRTSSSVDPGLVCASRTRLFESMVSSGSWDAQERFHASSDPDRPAFGIAMSRPDACTVSVTTVDVFGDRVRMAYRPLPGPQVAHVTELARV